MSRGRCGAVLLATLVSLAGCSTNAPPAPRPTPKPIVNLTCGSLEAGVTPIVAGMTNGRIVPGRGVANIDLGMTRDQVIATVGRPVCEVGGIGEDIWDFAPVTPDEPHLASRLFVFFDRPPDSNPKAKVVNMVAAGSGYQLEDGSPAFAPGSYDRFARLYAGRITASSDNGVWTYRVSPDPGAASGAVTTFNGNDPGPNALDLGTVSVSLAPFAGA